MNCSWRSSIPRWERNLAWAAPLTTRKIHWSDPKWKDTLAKTADRGLAPGLGLGRAGLVFQGTSVAYSSLGGRFAAIEPPSLEPVPEQEQPPEPEPEPEPITRNPAEAAEAPEITGEPSRSSASESRVNPVVTQTDPTVLELNDGRRINLGVLEPGLCDALCGFLRAVGPAARQRGPALGRGDGRTGEVELTRAQARLGGRFSPCKRPCGTITAPCRRPRAGW